MLVMDDGSTDDTAERVAPLEGRHGDVTVRLVSKVNGGKASALNTGIALARHEYVLCMDGDSKLEPQVLRVRDAALRQGSRGGGGGQREGHQSRHAHRALPGAGVHRRA
jgi:glycosyltransferase involved in cell wall biosynthesis